MGNDGPVSPERCREAAQVLFAARGAQLTDARVADNEPSARIIVGRLGAPSARGSRRRL